MGLRWVVMLENRARRTPEEINQLLATHGVSDEWTCFAYEGHSYASWTWAPRYFLPEEDPEGWEALRKYLVRARAFLGGGDVYLGNDLVHPPTPEDATERWPFFLPLQVPEACLAEPDAAAHPELAQIRELAGLSW